MTVLILLYNVYLIRIDIVMFIHHGYFHTAALGIRGSQTNQWRFRRLVALLIYRGL